MTALLARIQARPGFRAWARHFPLTRPVARARAGALFDLCAGAVYAQTLVACVRLNLFALLFQQPMDEATLASRVAVPQAGLQRLLVAAQALRLLRCRRGHWGLGPLGAAMIGNPGVAAMIAHHALLYDDLRDPVALLRAGQGEAMPAFWRYQSTADAAAYSTLMAQSQPMVAAEILDAYPLRKHRHLLDVGGGEGVFLAAVADRLPRLRRTLFELPPVAARAQVRLEGAVEIRAGDMLREPWPRGADVISLVRVLHDHDDAVAMRILQAARAALPPGGTLLIAEPMADVPAVAAYFSLYLLAMGNGRPRRAAELGRMLHRAGFARTRRHRTHTPLICQVLSAVNPA